MYTGSLCVTTAPLRQHMQNVAQYNTNEHYLYLICLHITWCVFWPREWMRPFESPFDFGFDRQAAYWAPVRCSSAADAPAAAILPVDAAPRNTPALRCAAADADWSTTMTSPCRAANGVLASRLAASISDWPSRTMTSPAKNRWGNFTELQR